MVFKAYDFTKIYFEAFCFECKDYIILNDKNLREGAVDIIFDFKMAF